MAPLNLIDSTQIDLADGTTMPLLGLGTYKALGRECRNMVSLGLELGYHHIDTAQIYDNQREIGKAIQDWERDDLFLTSKLWLGDHTKKRAIRACERILRELKTDYLDLLLVHWPDRSVPFAETLGAMAELQEEGKIRSFGVSNFTIRHLQDALKTGFLITVNQVELHPYFQQRKLRKFCQEHGIVLVSHSLFGRGLVERSRILRSLAVKHGKSAIQVTIRWALQEGIPVIPKAAKEEHLQANREVFDFELSDQEMETIHALDSNRRMIDPQFSDFDYC